MTMGSVLVLGGNSDIGKAVAAKFFAEGFTAVSAVRKPTNPDQLMFDATAFDSHAAFVSELESLPDVVVVAFGVLPDPETSFNQPRLAVETTLVNYTGVVSILGEFSKRMAERGSGTIIGISSVAGDRGRASNYLYGSAKSGVTTYLDGLRLFLAEKGVRVITVKPGFVRTKMTEHLHLPKKLTAEPEQVADAIFRAFSQNKSSVYTLPIWRLIMWVIKSIPESVFKRLRL